MYVMVLLFLVIIVAHSYVCLCGVVTSPVRQGVPRNCLLRAEATNALGLERERAAKQDSGVGKQLRAT